jgi:ribonuclease I
MSESAEQRFLWLNSAASSVTDGNPMKNRLISSAFILLSAFVNHSEAATALAPTRYGDFDNYVLALSWQTGFCQSMHVRGRNVPTECRMQQEKRDKTQFLTIHGLWPGLPKSIAARGVDNKRWMRYGCATRPVPDMPEAKSARKCALPQVAISPDIAEKLSNAMPGAGGNSCLERYEYAKHGVCFGFSPDAWFATMLRLNQEVRQSALGRFLAAHYGETVSRSDFNRALENAWGKNSVKAVKLTCHGNPAWLTEIQINLRADSINAPLNAHSFLAQPHPGNCAKRFLLDAAGFDK